MGDVVELRGRRQSGKGGGKPPPDPARTYVRQAMRELDCGRYWVHIAKSKAEKGRKRAEIFDSLIPAAEKNLRLALRAIAHQGQRDLRQCIDEIMGPDAVVAEYIGARKMLSAVLAAIPDYTQDDSDDAS